MTIYGEHPGHRESMGSCSFGNRLYIFGGNTSLDTQKDQHTNEFFVMKFYEGNMHSKRIIQHGDIPIKRLSCTLVAINKYEFALFGGESINGDFLNDLWYFNAKKRRWIELFPSIKISTR